MFNLNTESVDWWREGDVMVLTEPEGKVGIDTLGQ